MASSRKGRSKKKTALQVPGLPSQPLDVIQGIRLQVTGSELAMRLEQRIRWHRDRNDALNGQMKKFAEIERDAANELANGIGRYESPRIVLEKKVREHQERASFLMFLRDHIVKDATYRLDSIDLRMTEILPERSW
jgi:hypothetical protein